MAQVPETVTSMIERNAGGAGALPDRLLELHRSRVRAMDEAEIEKWANAGYADDDTFDASNWRQSGHAAHPRLGPCAQDKLTILCDPACRRTNDPLAWDAKRYIRTVRHREHLVKTARGILRALQLPHRRRAEVEANEALFAAYRATKRAAEPSQLARTSCRDTQRRVERVSCDTWPSGSRCGRRRRTSTSCAGTTTPR